MTSLVKAAAFVLLLQAPPAQSVRIDGTWLVTDPGTGTQIGTLEIRSISGQEYSFKGDFKSTAPAGLPPAWLASGKFSNTSGDFYWAAFDGREGRTTLTLQGERMVLDIRCMRGACANGQFRYEAARSRALGAPAPAPPPPAPLVSPPAPAASSRSVRVWQELRPSIAPFRVEFPGAPVHTTREVDNTFTGGKMIEHQWSLELDNNWTAYIAGVGQIPDGRLASASTDTILGDAVQGGVNNSGGVLVSQTPITIEGYPAREMLVDVTKDGSTLNIRARAILVKNRLFMLIAVTHKANSRREAGEVDRFLNSFRLVSTSAVSAPAPAAASTYLRAWQEMRTPAGGFRIEFPGASRYGASDVEDRVVGGTVTNHRWALELDNNWTAYIAGYADLPASRVQSLGHDGTLRDAVQGALANTGGTIVSETPTMVLGYPARDAVISVTTEGSTYHVRARVILVNRRMYQMIALSHATNSRLEPGEADRFLNSFRLIDR